MILIPFLHFFCFLVCASLAVYVLYQDWKSLLSRTCAILLCCFAIWNFGDIIVQNYDNSITANFATIIQNIASIGWIGFASAILCFSLAFAKQDELLRRIWFQILVISIPLFLMYLQWSGWLLVNPEKKPYGWFFDWSDSIWSYVFFAYYSVFTICSIVITYYHGRRTKKSLIRKQANIIFVSVTASLVIGSIFDVILPEMGISAFPTIANLFIFVFVIGLFYAIVRYRFLTITPAFAAENIISFMDELLILMSPLGKIVTVNKATLEVLQYNQADLENKSFSILAPNESGEENLFEKILKEETIKNGDGTLHSKTGKQIPIIYSCTFLKNEGGETIGVVFIARDITEHKHAENELRENEEKLRNILNSSPDAITISDLAGNITACNQATADLHGFGSEKDVIGCNCLSLIAPKSHLAAIEASAKLLQGSIIKGIEFTLRNCNGSEFPGEVSASVLRDAVGQPAAIICISKNISERKKIEVELRKSMQKAEESNRLKSAFLANMSHEIRTPMNGILGFAELLKRPNLSKKQQQDFIIMIEQSGTRLMNIINDVINLSKLEAGMTQVKISESNINDQMDFICSFFKPEASQKGIELSFDKPLPVGDSVIYTDKEKIYAILVTVHL
ncbi:MAG: PAS domain S-box protein [Bacteroidetes bacterium]|nr:PAS domain S-box protein [Bacteroidota bacterium]